MKSFIIIFIFSVSTFCFSQNWNVFNKNYRYNYKYNNSQLVSNVMFVDTVKIIGTDTVYTMNRIGVVTGNTLTTNKPQFLQRNIRKYSNGLVKLYDTTKIMIIPTCTLNQTWLFDSIYNLNATCIATATKNIFSISDSVKTILVNNVDTLVLSKQFGIIQFPKLHAQNKYYRLVGIEKANRYDSIPLFGLKVPNAWDFYNFNVGDKRCIFSSYVYGSPPFEAGCYSGSQIFNSKITLPNGFSYSIYEVSRTGQGNNQIFENVCGNSVPPPFAPPINSFSYTSNYNNLYKDSLIENVMYPGMTFTNNAVETYYGLVGFGLDNNGTFYKFIGGPCQTSNVTTLPNANQQNSKG